MQLSGVGCHAVEGPDAWRSTHPVRSPPALLASAIVTVESSAECPRSAELSKVQNKKSSEGVRVVADSAHASSAFLLFPDNGSYQVLQPKSERVEVGPV